MRVRVALGGALAAAVVAAGCTGPAVPVVDNTTVVPSIGPSSPAAAPNSVTVAVDGLGSGFNPHLLTDLSPVSQAIGALVLPSVFRPDAGGVPVMDPSLVTSADVTAADPFTVTYELRNAAQWSDGAPIAAEDFRYLWEQMTTQPGVVDPAGYQLIEDVSSSRGGKTVTVRFTDPYPAWRELFSALLPSHTLKDAPGGFASALKDTITFSGSRYAVTAVERDRGEVTLQRNDRFWDPPATLDEILLRRDGTSAQLAESLRTDDAQLALVRAGAGTRAQIGAVPDLVTSQLFLPSVMQIAVDTADTRLADPRVRRGLLGLLEPQALATVGTTLDASTDQSVPLARAQVRAPSQAGYAPTAPAPLSADEAGALLVEGGYFLRSGRYGDDTGPLTLVVGVDQNDPQAIAVAQAAADQLTGAGVSASLSPLPADALHGDALARGTVDLVVGRAAVGGDLATTMASRFGCAPRPVSPKGSPTAPTTPEVAVPDPTGSASPSGATPSGGAPAGGPRPGGSRAGNISAVCDLTIQASLRAALTGQRDPQQVADELEPQLWQLGAVLPLYQDAVLVAARPNLRGLALPGPLVAGPLADAATWTRDRG